MKVPFVDLKAQYASIRAEILETVERVLDSGMFVGGAWLESFEEEFARFVGARYAIGVGSGTAPLELALKTAGIGAGDEVVVPANSFFATPEAVSNVGARPVFADVDPVTAHLRLDSVEACITSKTRAIIPVHLYGRAMNLESMERLASSKRLEIIEDAAQAHGASLGGIPVGGSGRLTCFSFYPGKNLGAYGEAGMITCNDAQHAERLRLLRNHGSPSKYAHSLVGTNSRLDSLQAAILSVKLRHLPSWNSARIAHAKAYAAALRGSPVMPPDIPSEGEHNFHLFVIRTQNREGLKTFLQTRGIETGIHYPTPLHLTEAYQAAGHPGKGHLPVSEMLARQILSLPMYAELTEAQIAHVTQGVLEFAQSEQLAGVA